MSIPIIVNNFPFFLGCISNLSKLVLRLQDSHCVEVGHDQFCILSSLAAAILKDT
jgi:hypothetical protein